MDMQKLLRQAQEMQQKMEKEQAETIVEASVGGGLVKVKLDGRKNLVQVKIDPEAVDMSDLSMLEDLIVAAVSEANRKMDDALREKLGGMMSGMPKLF
jgi:DNA-binding YbaB/EbfC family protein